MPNANDLKYLVAIYKYDRTVNAAGTPIEQFKFYRYVYSSMKVLNTTLQIDNAPGTVSFAAIEFVIRHDPTIDYNCKLVDGANSYRIHRIEEVTRGGFLKLTCYVYNDDHAGESSYGG